MFEAYRVRSRLTPAERRASDEQLIEGAFSPADLLALIGTLVELARAGQQSARALKQAIITCCVFAPLLAVLGLALGSRWLALPAALLVLAVLLGLVRWHVKRFELPGQVPATAFPFLLALKHDLTGNESVRVRLDLSQPTAAAKRLGVSEPYELKFYYKVVDTTYEDPWFEGDARLTDGCHLRWHVTDELRMSVRKKRKSRGRTKQKTCWYRTSQIEVHVSFPAKRYRVESVPEVSGQKVSVRQNERRWMIAVKRKYLDSLKPRQLLDVVGIAFRVAKPTRRVA